MRYAILLPAAFVGAAVAPLANAAVCYVTTTGVPGNTGASWASTYPLQTALATPACTEVRVQAGLYKPTTDGNAAISFTVRPGVAVYGGFAGGETQRSQADPAAHITVLSGDLAGNDVDVADANGIDVAVSAGNGENSVHVVVMDGTQAASVGPSTVLDGFAITAGRASAVSGGGLYCKGRAAGRACNPTLSRLLISGNDASQYGGLHADGGVGESSPTLRHVVFRGNRDGAMGATASPQGQSSPILSDVLFVGNVSGNALGVGLGGASAAVLNDVTFNANSGSYTLLASAASDVHMELTNVTFSGNTVTGAVLANHGGRSTVVATNVTFADNASSNVVVDNDADDNGFTRITLHNAIFWNNTFASGAGQGLIRNRAGTIGANVATTATDHSIVQGSTGSGATWPAAYGTDGGSNLDADPLLGPLQDNAGTTPTRAPGATGAAVDAGDDTTCWPVDQRGVERPQGAHCDAGAVEVAAASTVLRLSDGAAYARYGTTRLYEFSVDNPYATPMSGIAVAMTLPPAVDAAAARWTCLAGIGATCAAGGTGALQDSGITIPGHGNVTWILSVPVRSNAAGDAMTLSATVTGLAPQPLPVSDTDTLTLFRDGFDRSGADGTGSAPLQP